MIILHFQGHDQPIMLRFSLLKPHLSIETANKSFHFFENFKMHLKVDRTLKLYT